MTGSLNSFYSKGTIKSVCVSVQALQDKATILIRETNPEFKASCGWAQKFLKRHLLVLRVKTSLSQKLPADLETKLGSFQEFVQRQRIEHDFALNMIGNMDEIPVYFDIITNKMIDKRGGRSVQVRTTGGDRRHNITVVLACTADGQLLPTTTS